MSEQAIARPRANDIQTTEHETLDRIATGTVTAVPFIGLGLVVWQTWASALHLSDFVVFAIMYLISGLGITVGFHRLLTHRSFKTKPWLRGVFAAMGSIAIEGPVISWVADHRKHHAFSDQEGDPHSPHAEFGGGFRGALRGLAHAHVGWLFIHTQRANKERYAPDLMKDPQVRFVERTFVVVGTRRAGAVVRARRADRRQLARGPDRPAVGRRRSDCCCSTTSPTRSTRCATSSAGAGSTRATSRATWPGSRRCRWARRGTTTITRSPRRPLTACGAGRSIRRRP